MDPVTTRTLATLSLGSYVKIVNHHNNRTHFNHTYTPGLNVCPDVWSPTETGPGGFYVCKFIFFLFWLNVVDGPADLALVELPADAQRRDMHTKTKVDRLVITAFVPLARALRWALDRFGQMITIETDIANLVHGAAHCNAPDLVRRVQKRVDPDLFSMACENALDTAIEKKRSEVVALLCQYLEPTEIARSVCWSTVIEVGDVAVLEALLSSAGDAISLTPLLDMAMNYGRPALAEALCRRGATVPIVVHEQD